MHRLCARQGAAGVQGHVADPGLYWGYIGIMEKKMETRIMGYIGYILGLYWGYRA